MMRRKIIGGVSAVLAAVAFTQLLKLMLDQAVRALSEILD
jgi:hypothetical protein